MIVPKGKLKGKMLEYFRQVEETGETLIVTDHGREVLEIRPLKAKSDTAAVISRLREKAKLSRPPDETELMSPIPDWKSGSEEIWLEEKK